MGNPKGMKEYDGGWGGQCGQPKDEQMKMRPDKVREVLTY